MTRKEFVPGEECTDDDLNAIVDDISLNQMIAVFPYSEKGTPFVSRVRGDADQYAVDGSSALLYSLRIVPVRGDFIWVRYQYKNATTVNVGNLSVAYRFYNEAGTTLYTEIVKSHSQSTSNADAVDVLDLSNVVTYGDLSARPLLMRAYAYWPSQVDWFDAVNLSMDLTGVQGLLSVVHRYNDGAFYVVGHDGSYAFWDRDHDHDSFSAKRDENDTYTRSAFCAYHENYGMMYMGSNGPTPGARSRRIANDVDHYTTGSPDSDGEDYKTPAGISSYSDSPNAHGITRDGNVIRTVATRIPTGGGAPTTRATLDEQVFSNLKTASPAWQGSANSEILNDGTNSYIPNSDSSHPDGAGLEAEIIDCFVLDHNPNDEFPSVLGPHYFCRYEWQGHANDSGGVIYQNGSNVFEYLDDLDNFYENSPLTYPEYGPIAPAVRYGDPRRPAVAVWEHVKIATDNHTLTLRILTRDASYAIGTQAVWNWETVRTITGITDSELTNEHQWVGAAGVSKWGSSGNGAPIDYAFDKQGGEHIVWAEYDSTTAPYRQVYYAYRGLNEASFSTPKKISTGSAWAAFIDASSPSRVYSVALIKDNHIVPWPEAGLRVAWGARTFTGATVSTFVAGLEVALGEDDISVYAPEVFMNDRDDTAGPQDMLW